MDFLKEYFDTISTRVKSPILGSVLLALVAANWKSIFYLFFAETPAAIRLGFVANSFGFYGSILLPVLGGVALALALPWINLGSARLVRWPLNLLRRLQAEEAIDLRIHKLDAETRLEAATAANVQTKERAKIAAAQILKDAATVDPSLPEKILSDREADEAAQKESPVNSIADEILTLSRAYRCVIVAIGRSAYGISTSNLLSDNDFVSDLTRVLPSVSPARITITVNSALLELEQRSLVTVARSSFESETTWTLTTRGFEIFDEITRHN